jgi:poly(A) polymerase
MQLESLNVGCDPDPSEQVDHTIAEPNVVFLWGLMYRNTQICTSSLKKDFMKSVINNIYGKEKCAHSDITMSIVSTLQPLKSLPDQSVHSQKLLNLPSLMLGFRQMNLGYQPMKQDCNAVG